MPDPANAIPPTLLARVVLGVRASVLDRPWLRASLRFVGRPLIDLMLRQQGPPQPAIEPPPPWDPHLPPEPVLRLPLDYAPGVLAPPPRIAVLLHVEDLEPLPEIARAIGRIPYPYEVFVSGEAAADQAAVRAAFGARRAGRLRFWSHVPGQGLQQQLAIAREVAGDHPYLLFLDTRSPGDEGGGAFVRQSLLGSPSMVRGALEAFTQVPELGILAPRTYWPTRQGIVWGDAYAEARDLAREVGFALYPDSPLDWPCGGTFWARAAAVLPLAVAAERLAPARAEAVLTRLLFHATEHAGFRWARAGGDAEAREPESFYRAEIPRILQRTITDLGRTVLRPGRHPQPGPPRLTGDAAQRKAAFRSLCREELDAFLASGARLVLPTSDAPKVSIIMVLYNQAELTFQCLRSLQYALDVPCEIIIADNASSDQTHKLLARVDGVRVVKNRENLHFLRGVNGAAGLARGEHLLLLNNDARVTPGSIAAAVRRLDAEPDLGAVGARIELLDASLQEAGSIIWKDGSCLGYGRGADAAGPEFQFRRDVDYCSGAFLMLPRALFERLGRFDEAFAPAYYEETDLCMRIHEAGLRIAYEPNAHISHFEFGSSSSSEAAIALQQRNHKLFAQRHAAVLGAAHKAPGSAPLQARMRGRHKGRVLIVDDQAPLPSLGSGYPRALEILRAVHEAGWFVTFYPMSYSDVDFASVYEVLPPEVEIAAERGRGQIAEFLRERAGYYDAAIVSRPHNMDAFRAALAEVPEALGLDQVVYDAEAIFAFREAAREALLGRPATAKLDAELALAQGAAVVLTVNALEAEAFREAGSETQVLGHALSADPTPSGFAERSDLLFVGALDDDDAPNADSLVFFVREVMPALDELIGADWVLRVAGRCGSGQVRALASDRVQLLGRVADLRPLYDRSRVFIAPTRFAAGIPMKVHEAAAAGLPAVATSLLAGQLGWADGEALLVGDAPEAFARACARLYAEPALWARIREGALARIDTDCRPGVFAERIGWALQRAKAGMKDVA